MYPRPFFLSFEDCSILTSLFSLALDSFLPAKVTASFGESSFLNRESVKCDIRLEHSWKWSDWSLLRHLYWQSMSFFIGLFQQWTKSGHDAAFPWVVWVTLKFTFSCSPGFEVHLLWVCWCLHMILFFAGNFHFIFREMRLVRLSIVVNRFFFSKVLWLTVCLWFIFLKW